MHYSINPDDIKAEIEKLGTQGRKRLEYNTIPDKAATLYVFCQSETCTHQ
jgi:hypothetical protein